MPKSARTKGAKPSTPQFILIKTRSTIVQVSASAKQESRRLKIECRLSCFCKIFSRLVNR